MISHNEHEGRVEQSLQDHRALRVENLENRNLFAIDFDDSMSEARPLGTVSEQPVSTPAEISEATDVDMFRVTLASGQTIDIDVDTPTNGPGGLGGYLRVFNEQGVEVAANNDAMAPDDGALGFDPYIRFTAQQNGNYYIAVSNWENTQFDPIGGEGDIAGQLYATGNYLLTVRGVPQFDNDDSISEAVSLGNVGPTRYSVNGFIDGDVDVDMFRIELMNGQSVEFDIDTTQNGPGGLGSYLTLFDANGNVIAANNDGAASGETLGFDAYLRLSVAVGGPYYLAVSNYGNTSFSPLTGNGDSGGSMYATGAYRLTIGEVVPGSQLSPSTTSDLSSNTDQAAPMVASPFADSLGNSPTQTGASDLDNMGSVDALNSSAMLGGSQLAESMDGFETSQVDVPPPILNPSAAFGSFDTTPMVTSEAMAMGTTAFNFGPGQRAFDEQLDSRNALATDLALMQSL